jgi:RND family efflux transporter MFP subunit
VSEPQNETKFVLHENTSEHAVEAHESATTEQIDHWLKEIRKLAASPKARKWLMIFVGLIAARFAVNFIFRDRPKDMVLSVHVVHPVRESLDSSLTLPGNIEALEQASLYAHVAGYLKKIYVDEGDRVKKGQLLAEIDAPDILDEYNKLKAGYNFKKITRDRYKDLLDDHVISQQEFDSVDSAYNEEKAKLHNSEANVEYTHIRAPFTGSIARRYKWPGDLIEVTTKGDQNPIFLLVNEEKLRIAINVPQSNLSDVKLGSPVDIKVDTFADEVFKGEVSRLDSLLDESTKTQRVLIDIVNSEGKLHAGMFVSVILHFQHKDDVLTIPMAAVDKQGDKAFVFIHDNGKAKRVSITLGLSEEEKVEVASGLSPNDEVILKGTVPPVDGASVQIIADKK